LLSAHECKSTKSCDFEEADVMTDLPISKRAFRSFLSHAHVDKKEFVDELHSWLSEFAGMKVWYDSVEFPSGLVASELGKAIENCQSAIIVLSEKSIASGWVEEEWNICVEQKNSNPDFQIVTINLDGCRPPAALRVRKWIDANNAELSPLVACQLIEALHGYATRPSENSRSTFYLSRGSRPSEVEQSERVLARCRNAGCRFVRDAPDQYSFNEERIKDIIASCGGVFAFLPNRGQGSTSKYILDEIRYAKDLNVPAIVFLEPGVPASAIDEILPKEHVVIEIGDGSASDLDQQTQEFIERVPPPLRNAHCFLGHGFQPAERELWKMARRVAEATSGLACISGDDLAGESAQRQIVDKIRTSAINIFDISEDRLNSCIEAGIARGAGARYELVCRGPRRRPPFIFRDKQAFFYDTPTELLGLVRKLLFEYRRLVT
jgi:hypothetical protein